MFNLSLNNVVDLATASTLGLWSVSGYMATNNCNRPVSTSDTSPNGAVCPVSNCVRVNLSLAIVSGVVSSGLYLYRGLR